MTRKNIKRPSRRHKNKGKRKAKEALGDDSGDDDPVNAIDDSPVNQYQTRANEGIKRKSSRTLHGMDSGDEEVLAAGRAQERTKRKAKRTRNDADSDGEVLSAKQIQLPFLQEEIEEEINLSEISLKALISRKQQLETDLSRSRYVCRLLSCGRKKDKTRLTLSLCILRSQEKTLDDRREELQERQLRLQAGRMKHLSLQKQLQDSLAKSRERLARLTSEDEKEDEENVEDENTKQADVTNSHIQGEEKEERSASPMKTRDLYVMLPGLPAVSIEPILLISVREASASDHLDNASANLNTDRDVRSHRRDLLWNTCLDLLQWGCPDDDDDNDTHQEEKDLHDDPPVTQTLSMLDPNVSLCPYELSGVCADDFCPYQHMDKGSMLPRERLILPSLKLPPPPSRDNNESDDGRPAETSEANTDAKLEPKIPAPVTTDYQDQPEEEKSQGSVDDTNALLLHDDSEPSENNDDNAFGEDFISLPLPPIEEESASEDEESVVDDEDVIVSSYLDDSTKANSVSFWWNDTKVLERNPTNVIHPNMSVTAWLDKVTGFRISGHGNASEYLRKDPTAAAEYITWLGQLVDVMRVSLHAGRHDITRGACQEWGEPLRVPDCLKPGLALMEKIAFGSSNQTSPAFFKVFIVQVSLSVVSQFLQETHTKETKIMDGEMCQRLVESVLGSDESTVAGDEVAYGSLVDGLRTELYRSTTLDCNDQERESFNVLKGNISWAMKLPGIDAFSIHQLDNRVLKPSWSLISRFLRRSVGQDRPFACTRAAIIMGYIILRCLERFAKKVNMGNDNLCASMTAALTTVDSTIYRILLELSDLISDIPLLELLLSPVYAASVSTACFLRLYATAQHRLETVLGAQGDKRFQVRKQGCDNSVPFARYSELLWSQLCHLRMALPCESPRKDNGEKVYYWEPSPEVIESQKTLGSRIAEYGIHLRHIRLDGGRTMFRSRRGGTLFSTALSLALLTAPSEESVVVNIDGVSLVHEPDERTRVPSPLRSALPRSIMLAGPALTKLSLVGCKLTSLPASFGLYFPRLDVSELCNIRIAPQHMNFLLTFHVFLSFLQIFSFSTYPRTSWNLCQCPFGVWSI
jgi:hypothetical protein